MTVLKSILNQGAKAGFNSKDFTSRESIEWFRNKALSLSSPTGAKVIRENPVPFRKIDLLSVNSIGKMYLFRYDPKLKNVLPYYDTYPLIFPIEFYSDGFLGINLHYLPPLLRGKLMDSLLSDKVNNNKYNSTTKLKISYAILKSASEHAYFKPCVKRYLFSHRASLFLYIAPEEWNIAMMLPLQKFAKESAEKVWADSANKLGIR
jgi:hypothetical protein